MCDPGTGDGGGFETVSLKERPGVHDGELDPSAGHQLETGTNVDVPAAGPAGDAGASRGNAQLGSGAYRCSVSDVHLGAQAVLVVVDDLA